MDCKEVTNYMCVKCGTIFNDRGIADRCCAPKFCEDCGGELPYRWPFTVCKSCREKRLFNDAVKLESWDGCIYAEGYGLDDGYFLSVLDLLDYCDDENIEPPKWVFACHEIRHQIDIDDALEMMLDDAHEGAEDALVDIDELRKFIEKWNSKQSVVSYYPDRTRIVLMVGNLYGGTD